MKQLFQFLGLSEAKPAAPPAPAEETSAPVQFVIPPGIPRALASIVTHAWKAQQRLKPRDPASEPTDEQRRLLRHIEAILDEANELGITIKDRVYEVFDYGLPEKVVASEPQAGLNKPVVKETIRPTISWRDQILVHGEVILAIPVETPSSPASNS
jgi:hypothetical protein